MYKRKTFTVAESKAKYGNTLREKSFSFAVRIVKFYKYLLKKDKDLRSIYEQLLRSGTSIGANVSEAQSAHSKKDFVNKLDISLKESRETDFWLKVFHAAEIINENEFESMFKDCDEIERLLVSSIKTAKGNSIQTPNVKL
ncbi:MAG: four helix bundle protein [Ignavibacteriales bacterium]|nr:four helix bundle protein [Ignavibacteriales bacterium]